jgi:hypothetical protein
MAVTGYLIPPLVISSPVATSVDAVPVTGLSAPVAAGTVVYNCTVQPTTWTGTVSLKSTAGAFNQGSLAVGPITGNTFTIVAGQNGLGSGSFDATISLNP